MKKATIFILSSVVLALAVLYVLSFFVDDRKNPWIKLGLGKNNTEPTTTAIAPKDYRGSKMQVILHAGTDLYPTEVELLQRLINAYGVSVPITGRFDEITEKAVTDITGKGATTISEFRFKWMVNKNLKEAADKIVNGEA